MLYVHICVLLLHFFKKLNGVLHTLKVVPLLIDSMSIGLRSDIVSSLLLLVAFVLIGVLLTLLISGKGGGGGGAGILELVLEGGAGGGGGGGGGKVGAIVTIGGGGLDGKVLCADIVCGIVEEALGDALAGTLGGMFSDTEDTL